MATMLYRRDNGEAITFAHTIDAKESMQSGFYSASPPPSLKKQEVVERLPAKPTVIPTVEDKKPTKPIVKDAPIVEEDVKPVVKSNPRIIRK